MARRSRRAAAKPDTAFPGSLTPPWRRAGGFVFLGTHTPHRPDTGALVATEADLPPALAADARRARRKNLYVDVLRDGIAAQTAMALDNLRASLEAAGSALDRVAHLRLFIHDPVDELFALQTAERAFGGALPSGEIVVARNRGTDPAVRVHADALAFARDSGHAVEHVTVDGLAPLTRPFPSATRAGPYVFTSCFAGLSPDGGRIAAGLDDLDTPERAVVRELGPLPASQFPFIVQQAAMWGHARRLLARLGIPLEQVFYHLAWLGISMRQLGNGSVTRLVSPLVRQYCLTCFPVAGRRRPDALIEGRYVALDPRAGVAKNVAVPRHGISNSYYGAIQAGDLLVAAGEVPIDTARQRVIAHGPDLAARRGAEFGLVHADRRISVEAAYVYDLIGDSLAAYGMGFGDLRHQTLYLCDASEHAAALLGLAGRMPGGALPATTIAPIEGASPFADTRLEVEFMAVRERPGAGARRGGRRR